MHVLPGEDERGNLVIGADYVAQRTDHYMSVPYVVLLIGVLTVKSPQRQAHTKLSSQISVPSDEVPMQVLGQGTGLFGVATHIVKALWQGHQCGTSIARLTDQLHPAQTQNAEWMRIHSQDVGLIGGTRSRTLSPDMWVKYVCKP